MRSEVVKVYTDSLGSVWASNREAWPGFLGRLASEGAGKEFPVRITVEVIETPRERLKRAKAEAFNKEDFESGYSVLFKAVTDYLAATEGEGK